MRAANLTENLIASFFSLTLMARRAAKKKRVRRSTGFSILGGIEAYTYASILTMGFFGQKSPLGFLGIGSLDGSNSMVQSNGGVTLQSLLNNPQMALEVSSKNAVSNLTNMALQSFLTGVSFRVARSMLRKPISVTNQKLMKPLFGRAVKI